MKYLDLATDNARSQAAIESNVKAVMAHGRFILGPEITELEKKIAHVAGTQHALAVSSGTAALHVALLGLGVGPGDEVITSPFSFFASAEVIVLTGATPVFVDIDQRTFNMNPQLLEAAITDNTKAIMPVSMFGQPADMDPINAIAAKYQLPVVEDGAQSFGASYHGKPSCGLTTIGCTSFYPTKPLGAMGDGGACFTNDAALAEKMRLIHNHGQSGHYHHTCIGMNYRMNTMQAAVLLAKLDDFSYAIKQRRAVAAMYQQALEGVMPSPYILEGCDSVYAQYTIRSTEREALRERLAAHDIPTAIHYPLSLHLQPAIVPYIAADQSFPESERATAEVMSLPFFPEMTVDQVTEVAKALQVAATVQPEETAK
ncbi:MAG: DegT/DnrJ/EryC1/StrS family aminotransferase [Coxiellaceae bacterium]|nr:DegT/DnrJ/EryC1/StrS family aminotransferase [Coxiellaceae bacterium]